MVMKSMEETASSSRNINEPKLQTLGRNLRVIQRQRTTAKEM